MRKVKPSELQPILTQLVESQRMSEKQAEAIYLHIVERKTHVEIARINGITLKAAEQRCFKGIQRLLKLGFALEGTRRRSQDNEEATIDFDPVIKRYADMMRMTFDEALKFIGTRSNLECAASLLGIEMSLHRGSSAKFQVEALDKYLRSKGYVIEQKFETGLEQYLRGLTG